MVVFLVIFGVILIFVMAFKKNKSETTVTKKDEDGNVITEHYETVHHSAGQTAARFVVGILVILILLLLIFIFIVV